MSIEKKQKKTRGLIDHVVHVWSPSVLKALTFLTVILVVHCTCNSLEILAEKSCHAIEFNVLYGSWTLEVK